MKPRAITERGRIRAVDTLFTLVRRTLLVALRDRGQATLSLSGGDTPRVYLPQLFDLALPWHRIRLSLVDERCVPQDDPDSNEGLIRSLLRGTRASRAHLHGLVDQLGRPLETELRARLHESRPVDLALLGCGGDGHVASLFGRVDPPSKLRTKVVETRSPNRPFERVSLTPAALHAVRFPIVVTRSERWSLVSSRDWSLPIVRFVQRYPRRVPVVLLD